VNGHNLISIICPVFNEEESIPLFYSNLQAALADLRARYDFELIFTNNRSQDRTLDVILELRHQDPAVQVLTFSRNFGYQASVMAGLRHAAGDAAVVIDVDCEDPPAMIPEFVEEWEKGFDIVYGERADRPESAVIKGMRKLFYRLNRLVSDSDIILDMAEFALISSRVRDLMLSNRSTFPFLRTETAFVGFERKGIAYKRHPRLRGKTHYNFWSMTQFAIGGILSSSTFPLRVVTYTAVPLAIVNLILLYLDLFRSSEKAFHLLVALDFQFAIFCLTSLAIYLARTYKNAVARPIFIVDWKKSILNDYPARNFTWTTNEESPASHAHRGNS
jgi:glycosyltransferase involved in cell wall biosynthesis